jgi:glycosyltransferase involved in cell wall biosynthesis
MLKRALHSLQAQSVSDWRCTVFDDSKDNQSEALCEALGDERITYIRNDPRQFAAANIDQCFKRAADSDYYFVLEDDNFVLPSFIEENLALIRAQGVQVLMRNQYKAPEDVAPESVRDGPTVLASMFVERTYSAQEFSAGMLMGVGMSNGALFWSRAAQSNFEIGAPALGPIVHEYVRAAVMADDVYVALKPLGVWTHNAEASLRSAGSNASRRQEGLEANRSLQLLRAAVAARLGEDEAARLMRSEIYAVPLEQRERVARKFLLAWRGASALGVRERVELRLRGEAIRRLGRAPEGLEGLIATRLGGPSPGFGRG